MHLGFCVICCSCVFRLGGFWVVCFVGGRMLGVDFVAMGRVVVGVFVGLCYVVV